MSLEPEDAYEEPDYEALQEFRERCIGDLMNAVEECHKFLDGKAIMHIVLDAL